MTLFIFEGLSHVSEHYHEGGGCVVVAENYDAAIRRAKAAGVDIPSVEAGNHVLCEEYDLAWPYEERVFIFPDAGCC